MHLAEVIAVVIDMGIVIYGIGSLPVGNQFLFFTQSVFHDKQRFAVAVIKIHQRDAQADRILLPAPFTRLQIRILQRSHGVAGRKIHPSALFRSTSRHVVGKGDEVHGPGFHEFEIFVLHHDIQAVIFKP